MEQEKQIYEIGYLLKVGLKEEDVLIFSEKLRGFITDKSGLILSEGKPKKQILAYIIEKEESAIFNWLKFLINPSFIEGVESYLKKNEPVLRFLTIKTKKEEPQKTPILRRPKTKIIKKEIIDTGAPQETKEPIKEEEIDKKIEELLGE